MTSIPVMRRVLASNDALAAEQLARLDAAGVFGINLMSGPGAGKTSLVERTVERLGSRYHIHVIEGDIKGDLDAQRVAAKGGACTQINTDGACHLDSLMLQGALTGLDLTGLDLLIIENVGNLVCPAEFALPAHKSVTLISTPEGSDKPVKYPLMFSRSDAVLVTKTDLLPYVDFDVPAVKAAIRKLKPDMPIIELSARTDAGLDAWYEWLEAALARNRGEK
jgi:hydrogenase nickel incorporation protein HypB